MWYPLCELLGVLYEQHHVWTVVTAHRNLSQVNFYLVVMQQRFSSSSCIVHITVLLIMFSGWVGLEWLNPLRISHVHQTVFLFSKAGRSDPFVTANPFSQ